MTTVFARRRAMLPILGLALILAGCESRTHLTLTPSGPVAPAVPAIARALPSGAQKLVIPDPAQLPADVRQARDLKVSIAGRLVNVTKAANGAYELELPPGIRPTVAKDGTMSALFVMEDAASRLVALQTGSMIAFQPEPVVASPSGRVPLGRAVSLEAATDADEQDYEFTWAAAPSAEGPWQALPAAGKRVTWTPQAPGSYFLRVEAIDRARRVSYASQTSTRALHVVEPDAFFTIGPASGAIARGATVDLAFALPDGEGRDAPHTWYAGLSAQGPWTLLSGQGATNTWLPTLPGSYHLRVDLGGKSGGDTFISTRPLVRVLDGAPIISASRHTADRGDRVDLKLAVPASGMINWQSQRVGGPWTPIPGNGETVKFFPDQPGAYHFKADLTQPDGTVRSLTTTDPILNVADTPGFLTTHPFPAIARPGESVSLIVNARGITDGTFTYVWYVSPNPAMFGWTPVPFNRARDARDQRVRWDIPQAQARGNYFVRVDAVEDGTGHVYSFTSTSALILLGLDD